MAVHNTPSFIAPSQETYFMTSVNSFSLGVVNSPNEVNFDRSFTLRESRGSTDNLSFIHALLHCCLQMVKKIFPHPGDLWSVFIIESQNSKIIIDSCGRPFLEERNHTEIIYGLFTHTQNLKLCFPSAFVICFVNSRKIPKKKFIVSTLNVFVFWKWSAFLWDSRGWSSYRRI